MFQEELLELQANEELKSKFKLGYRIFWLQRDIQRLYPRLWPIRRCGLANEKEKQTPNCKSGRPETPAN
uniref:Uncharacterized protein n=1 Tax=Trichuris muris TaxID=70415 RepID=A0A5S6QCE3_TRIMR